MSYVNKSKLIVRLNRELDLGYHGQPLRTIELVKAGDANDVKHIFDWQAPWPEVADLASEVDEKIGENLDENQEPVTIYKILFRHGSSDQPKNGPFVVRVENIRYEMDPDLAEMAPREGPTPRGITTMLQRHLEGYVKMTVGERQENMRIMRDFLRDAQEELRDMRRERMDLARLQQDLLDRSQERKIAAMKAQQFEELKANAVRFLLPLVPIVANKLQGARTLPESESAETMMVKGFVMGLKDEDIHLLLSHFGPRLAPIQELIIKWKTEHDAQEQKRKDFVNSVTPEMPPVADNPALQE